MVGGTHATPRTEQIEQGSFAPFLGATPVGSMRTRARFDPYFRRNPVSPPLAPRIAGTGPGIKPCSPPAPSFEFLLWQTDCDPLLP